MLLIIDNQGGFAREVAPFAEELNIIFARDAAQVTPNLPILKPEDVIIVPHTNMETTLREQGITNKIVPLQYRNATVQDLYIAAMGHPRYGTYLDNPFELVAESAPAERPAPAPKTDKRPEAPRNEQREPRQEQRQEREPRQERRDEQRRDNKRDDRRDNKNQRQDKQRQDRQGDKQRQDRRDNKNQRQDKQRQDREQRQEREPRQDRRDEQRRDNKRDEQRRQEPREQVIAAPEVKPEPVAIPAEPVFEIPAFDVGQTEPVVDAVKAEPVVEAVKPEPVAETAKPKPQVGPRQVREVLEFEVETRTDGRVNEGTVKVDRPGRNGYVDYLVYADGRKEEIGRRNPVSRQERIGTKPVPKDEGSGAPASEPETIVPAFDFGGGPSVVETEAQDIQIGGPVIDMGSEPVFKTDEPVFVTEPKVDAPVFKTAEPEINFVSEDDKPVFKTEPATPRFTDEPSFKTEPAAPNFVTEDEAPNFVTEPVADAPVFKTEEPVFKTEAAPNFVTETPTVRVQPQAAPAQQAPKPVIRQRNAGDFDDDELGLVRDQAPEPADEGGDFTLNFI